MIRKVVLPAIMAVFVLNTHPARGVEENKCNFILSFGPGVGRFENLKVYDTYGNPFYYCNSIAYPVGISMEGFSAGGIAKGILTGFFVGSSYS